MEAVVGMAAVPKRGAGAPRTNRLRAVAFPWRVWEAMGQAGKYPPWAALPAIWRRHQGKKEPQGRPPWRQRPEPQPGPNGEVWTDRDDLRVRERVDDAAECVGVFCWIEPEVGKQLGAFAVLDEAVGQAEADDVTAVESSRVGGFQ